MSISKKVFWQFVGLEQSGMCLFFFTLPSRNDIGNDLREASVAAHQSGKCCKVKRKELKT